MPNLLISSSDHASSSSAFLSDRSLIGISRHIKLTTGIHAAATTAGHADLIYLYCRSDEFKSRLYEKIKPVFIWVNHVEEESVVSEFIRSLIFHVIIHNVNYCFTHQDEISIDEVIIQTLQIIVLGMHSYFE